MTVHESVKSYITHLFKHENIEENDIAEEEVHHEACRNINCIRQATQLTCMQDEKVTLTKLINHLECRIIDQETIVNLLKSDLHSNISSQALSADGRQKHLATITESKNEILQHGSVTRNNKNMTSSDIQVAETATDRNSKTSQNSNKENRNPMDRTKNMNEEQEWTEVRKGRRRRQDTQTQTRGSATEESCFKAAGRRAWLYVGGTHANTTSQQVLLHLKQKFPNESFDVEEIQKHTENKSKNKSFKVGCEYDILDKINKCEIWPSGVLVKRYKFFRSRNTEQENKQI